MRRFTIWLTLATMMSLVYVHERVILIITGYGVEELRRQKDDLLDQHRVLHYNVLTLQSPVILNQRLAAAEVTLTPPQTIEILNQPKAIPSAQVIPVSRGVDLGPLGWLEPARRLAVRWLGGERQAVAEPAL